MGRKWALEKEGRKKLTSLNFDGDETTRQQDHNDLCLATPILAIPASTMTPPMPNECRDPAFAAVTSLPGLQGPATVLRDANGMAHVDCTTEHDAFFLQGFITAADRMFSMDAARRKALGTQAELMGNAFVGEDKLLRTMGVPESCSADWEETQKIGPVKNMFDAFTDGVNAFTEWGRANGGWGVEYAELGVEPEKWEPHVSSNST